MLSVDEKQLSGLADDNLIAMAEWLSSKIGTLVVTSLHRAGDSGVHGTIPCRGIDVRCRDKDIGEAIVSAINKRWQYDHERINKKCAILHDVGFGLHLHLQVHPNTRKKL